MILDRLENLPLGRFQYKLLAVTGLGWLFDAMDTGLIAFVLPVLAREWGLTPAQAGWIGSIGLIGMALGAVLAGTIADRIGRKQVFTITVLLYSISTGLCAVAWNYESLLVFRFLVGFGLGGELPVAATLMSEYAPAKLRGRFIVLLESFWGLGWLAAACIAYLLIPVFGWQAAFLIGALPALYVFLLRLHMPESIRYLLSKGRVDEAKAIIRDIERQLKMPERPFLDQLAPGRVEAERVETPGFASLWAKGMRRRTAMLWLAWFGIVFSYYGIFMWLPSIVYAQGFEIVKTFEYVLIMTLAQLPGYYAAAYLVDVIGRRYTLGLFLLLSGVCSHGTSRLGGSDELLQPRGMGRDLHLYAGAVSDVDACTWQRLGGGLRAHRRHDRPDARRCDACACVPDERHLYDVRSGLRIDLGDGDAPRTREQAADVGGVGAFARRDVTVRNRGCCTKF